MSEEEFVQGDTAPPITGQILKKDGTARTLADATSVRFQMRKEDDQLYTVDAAAQITDAPDGRVSYSWAANDLSVPGEYLAQWEVHYSDGKVQTTTPPNTVTVRRQ
jgi:hypothetical protein